MGKAEDFDLDPARGVAYLLYPADATVKKLILEKGQFDPAFKKVGGEGTGLGNLTKPVAVAVDPYGNVLVADADSKRLGLVRFNQTGECLGRLGGEDYADVVRIASATNGGLFCMSDDGVIEGSTASDGRSRVRRKGIG